MGTNYNGEGITGGIIPKVMENIFNRVENSKESTEFLIRVSFIEVHAKIIIYRVYIFEVFMIVFVLCAKL